MHPRSREIRLRNAAKRQGFELRKSRRRDAHAIGYGRFCLVDRWRARVIGVLPGFGFGMRRQPIAEALNDLRAGCR